MREERISSEMLISIVCSELADRDSPYCHTVTQTFRQIVKLIYINYTISPNYNNTNIQTAPMAALMTKTS